jgi:putative serine protease PepD
MTEQQGWPAQHIPPQPAPPHVPHMQHPFGPAQVIAPQSYSGPSSVDPARSAPKKSRAGLVIAGIVAAVLISGGSAVAGGYTALQLEPQQTQTVAAPAVKADSNGTTTLSNVAEAVLPSVVSIQTGTGLGSGVVITADGAILTNNHVVEDARGDTVQVTFSTGKTATATIVGTDPSNDLAVVKVSGVSGLTPLAFGDSGAVHVGDTVLAVGSPLGLNGSVTSGIVSALNRTIDESGSQGNGSRAASSSPGASITGALQTDAAINPGNSGGALVNTAGQLIGINTAIASTSQASGNIGVGFAISSNTAKQVVDKILN